MQILHEESVTLNDNTPFFTVAANIYRIDSLDASEIGYNICAAGIIKFTSVDTARLFAQIDPGETRIGELNRHLYQRYQEYLIQILQIEKTVYYE